MREISGRLGELPRDRRILVLCHHGSRSRDVTEYLRAHGFPAASNVRGGIAAWAEHINPAMQRY
jgi:adenylyltransferase/sulfurtransferase